MSQSSVRSAPVDGVKVLRAVKKLRRESLTGVYYVPFNVNSKNWMHVPKETEAWLYRLGKLLQASTQLTKQKEHSQAVACFKILQP